MKLLIIEPFYSGHHLSLYLKSLISGDIDPNKVKIGLLTTTDTIQTSEFQTFVEDIPIDIKIHSFRRPQIYSPSSSVKVLANQIKWRISIEKSLSKLKNEGYQTLHFNTLDFLFHSFLIKRGICKFKISGVQMKINPLRNLDPESLRFRVYLKLIRRFLCYPNTKQIFLIDEKIQQLLTTSKILDKISYVPDPIIFNYEILPKIQKTKTDTINILLYGSITERKGLEILLNFLKKSAIKNKYKIVVAGKIKKEYQTKFDKLLDLFKIESISIQVVDRWISSEEQVKIFQESHLVWLCYEKTFLGSSGVLYQAGNFSLPIITNNVGLVSEINKKYSLGIICDSDKIEESMNKIDFFVTDRRNWEKYCRNGYNLSKSHSANHFSKKLITKICHQE